MRRASPKALLIMFVVFLPAVLLAREKEKPPTPVQLAEISERGKLLAKYDQIAWHATDEMLKEDPKAEGVRGFVVEFKGDDWLIVFGHLSSDGNSLCIPFQATTNPALRVPPNPIAAAAGDCKTTDRGDLFREFVAMDTARSAFGKQSRPFNDAVLPAPSGQHWVYFYPASTDAKILPMGGDIRYLVSSDGKTIVETRKLHASIREEPTTHEGSAKIQSAYHTHVLSDVPEDTDVMYVLMRHPPIPEYVASKKYIYTISANGDIEYLGETDKVLKK